MSRRRRPPSRCARHHRKRSWAAPESAILRPTNVSPLTLCLFTVTLWKLPEVWNTPRLPGVTTPVWSLLSALCQKHSWWITARCTPSRQSNTHPPLPVSVHVSRVLLVTRVEVTGLMSDMPEHTLRAQCVCSLSSVTQTQLQVTYSSSSPPTPPQCVCQ